MSANERETLRELIRTEPSLVATLTALCSEMAAVGRALQAARARHDLDMPPLKKRHDELSQQLAAIAAAKAKLAPPQTVKTGEPAPIRRQTNPLSQGT